MFRLDLSPTFRAPVRFEVQGATGSRQQLEFLADFHRLDADELQDLSRQAMAGEASDRQIAQRLLAGWDGVADAAGVPLAFTPDNVQQVLRVAGVAAAVVQAFRQAQPTAALGN